MQALLALSFRIERTLGAIAMGAGWLLVALMALTCFDVVCRKIGVPLPYTKLQELEWHLHTVIFACWLGFNYTINAHPRVDSYVENVSLRGRAWIELCGCLVFALPYIAAVLWFGFGFVKHSWLANEASEAANGLPYRWILKSILYAGVALVLVAIISVMIKLLAVLFGGKSFEEARLKLGPAVSDV